MATEGKSTDLSLLARAVQAARYVVRGVQPDDWFGPAQPLEPMAPASVTGRRFDYPVAANLDTRPRGYESISFADLRGLAENCDVLRSVIETRKDQMEAQDWTIRLKGVSEKNRVSATAQQEARMAAITLFFQSPDREGNWAQWQRQLLEDMFVIDAATLYRRRDRKGRLYALEVVDGATIKLLLDDTGRRPLPPDPAYQQILKGVPAVDYTRDELLYLVHNPRSHKVYGYSHVEQIILTVNTAIRRAVSTLDYYREGSQPDAFGTLPAGWTTDQVRGFQDYFDSLMATLANRRKLRFMPDGFKYTETKQAPLKDQYDEWLARVICFVFSISPEPFVQHTNRGTAETAHDRALQEGLAPLQRWVKALMDRVLVEEFNSPDLEFAWLDDREQDPKQAADINVEYAKTGILSVDEVRERIGEDPLGGAFAVPMLATATGYVALTDPEEQQARAEAARQQLADAQAAATGQEATEAAQAPAKEDQQPAQKAAYTRLRKRAYKPIPFDRPATRHARAALKRQIKPILHKAGQDAARQVRQQLGKLAKDASDAERARRLAQALDLSPLDLLVEVVPGSLEAVTADSGRLALAQLGADSDSLVNQVNARAAAYARDRAAEMIGKRYDANGALVDNPEAQWRIDEATRDELQAVITQGLEDNLGRDAIAEAIQQAGAFSADRAALIANTEIARANSGGALQGYQTARESGVAVQKAWLPDDEPCADCQANADAGPIDLDDAFPSGDEAPPGHPRCECAIMPVTDDGNETDDSEEE